MLKQGNIVALDSVKNLIRTIPGCALRLRLSPEALPPALQNLMVSHEDGYYILGLSEYGQLEEVMAALRTAGSKVLEMQVLQPDLEEVFVKIMAETKTAQALSS